MKIENLKIANELASELDELNSAARILLNGGKVLLEERNDRSVFAEIRHSGTRSHILSCIQGRIKAINKVVETL